MSLLLGKRYVFPRQKSSGDGMRRLQGMWRVPRGAGHGMAKMV
jgi:hypothetical protein